MTKGKLDIPSGLSAAEKLRIATAALWPWAGPVMQGGLTPVQGTYKLLHSGTEVSVSMHEPGEELLIYTLRVVPVGRKILRDKGVGFLDPVNLHPRAYTLIRTYMMLGLMNFRCMRVVSMPINRNRPELGLNYSFEITLHADSIDSVVLSLPLRNNVFSVERNMARAIHAVRELKTCMIARNLAPRLFILDPFWESLALSVFAFLQGLVISDLPKVEWTANTGFPVAIVPRVYEGVELKLEVTYDGVLVPGVSQEFDHALQEIIF